MSEFSLPLQFVLSALAGMLLAFGFFAGLWWTVNRILTSPSPHLLVGGSFLIRMAIVLMGFWYIAREGWQQLLVAAGSFLLMRFLLIKRLGSISAEIPQRGVG